MKINKEKNKMEKTIKLVKEHLKPDFTGQDVFGKEHNCWVEIWKLLSKLFSVTREELNKPKYRELAVAIERWAYYDNLRRAYLEMEGSKWADEKGVFYKGD